MSTRTHRIALLVACAVTLAHSLAIFLLVHGPIAIHFDLAGQANDWGTATTLVTIELVMTGMSLLFFLGIPLLLSRSSNERINLPNKSYWLAPERRAETLGHVQRVLHLQGVANQLFVMGINTLVAIGGRSEDGPPPMMLMLVLIAAYTASILTMLVRLLWRFRRGRTATR